MYERYCEIRDTKGLKDSDVARLSGVTKSTFSDWKAGRYEPKDEKLEKIASVLGTTAKYLRTGKMDEVSPDDIAIDDSERELLMLCRNATKARPEDKKVLVENFKSTIDVYLQAKGLK